MPATYPNWETLIKLWLKICIHKNLSSRNIDVGNYHREGIQLSRCFSQISSKWLLNFKLESKVIPSNFSEKEFFTLKFSNFRKFWSYSAEDCVFLRIIALSRVIAYSHVFNRRWHLSVYNFIWLSENQITSFSPIFFKLTSPLLHCLWPEKVFCHLHSQYIELHIKTETYDT